MSVDATHPGCFVWRERLHVTPGDRDLAVAEVEALEQWRSARREVPTEPLSGSTAVGFVGAVMASTVVGIAAGAGIAVWAGSTVLGAVVGILLTAVLSILALGIAVRWSPRRPVLQAAGPDLGPAPLLTQTMVVVPDRVVAAAPPSSSAADLVRWSRTLSSYESAVASLPAVRRSVADGEWALPLPRRDDFHDPWSLWHHERDLRGERRGYVRSCHELSIEPVDEPAGLATGHEPARPR